MSPVVAKTLAVGLALLYVGGITAALLGGVVPGYETRAGAEMSERVVATAAGEIERAPPATDGHVDARKTITLPEMVANSGYTLELSNGTDSLALRHSDPALETETRLALPPNLEVHNGTVESGNEIVIHVSGPPDDRTLTMEAEG